MKNVQRIEVIINAPHAPRVIDILASAGLRDYTVIRGASGSGERGLQRGDDITGVSNNVYILTTCAPEDLDGVVEPLRPLLRRAGGVCLVSEARWLEH